MTQYLDWKVGDKVVFVGFSNVKACFNRGEELPKINNIYSIREILISPNDYICIRLNEIINPVLIYPDVVAEAMFMASAFRKVKETNIDVFKKMLNKTPAQNNKELVESEMKKVMEEV